jgi:hypothetical protein
VAAERTWNKRDTGLLEGQGLLTQSWGHSGVGSRAERKQVHHAMTDVWGAVGRGGISGPQAWGTKLPLH